LFVVTGANVYLLVVTPSGKRFSYASHPVEMVSVETQTEEQTEFPPMAVVPIEREHHTPIKTITTRQKRLPASCTQTRATPRDHSRLVVEDLPGKQVVPKGYTCQVCEIVYGSVEDVAFRKGNERKTTWVGCDKARCNYWAHACCANLVLKPRVPVDEHSFLCYKHKKR